MLKKFFDNTRKPRQSFSGRFMLKEMNKGHNKMALKGLSFLKIEKDDLILDVGCGGGKNISNFLERTKGKVYGLDYSKASVEMSKKLNKKAMEEGRVEIIEASVEKLPFEDESFNIVSAFETIYFWPDIEENFKEVNRVLKKNGRFLITNEVVNEGKEIFWQKIIDMKVYSQEYLVKILEKAGFKIVTIEKGKNFLAIISEK